MKNQNITFHIFKWIYVAARGALEFGFVGGGGLQCSVNRLDLGSRMKSGKYDPLMATWNGGFAWQLLFSVNIMERQ